MHFIEPWRSAVTLFRDDGEVWVYRSVDAARRALGMPFICRNVGRHFVEYLHRCQHWEREGANPRVVTIEPIYEHHRYVMRDDFGQPLTAADFELPGRPKPNHWPYGGGRFRFWNGEGAVPRTGHGRRYRQWRKVRTRQEARLNDATPAGTLDGEPPARPCRTRANLPNTWDDISRDYERNWKRYRGRQCKGAG